MTGRCLEGSTFYFYFLGYFNCWFLNIFRIKVDKIKHNCYNCRYNDIEQISKEYAIEKVELEEALAALAEVENRKNELLEEKRLEEVRFHHPLNYIN